MSGGLSDRERIVLDALTRAASAGEPCPSNAVLVGMIGCSSVSCPANIVSSLERAGLIAVERFQRSREVFVVALGKSTAGVGGKRRAHVRTGAPKSAAEPRQYRRFESRDILPVEILPPAVYRDPCPRCGTRADIGCVHSAVRITMGAFA